MSVASGANTQHSKSKQRSRAEKRQRKAGRNGPEQTRTGETQQTPGTKSKRVRNHPPPGKLNSEQAELGRSKSAQPRAANSSAVAKLVCEHVHTNMYTGRETGE